MYFCSLSAGKCRANSCCCDFTVDEELHFTCRRLFDASIDYLQCRIEILSGIEACGECDIGKYHICVMTFFDADFIKQYVQGFFGCRTMNTQLKSGLTFDFIKRNNDQIPAVCLGPLGKA